MESAPPNLSAQSQTIEQAEIRTLIPHAHAMCLLQRVLAWSYDDIECVATSHRDLDNPLRHDDCLPIHAGIEYCAQAIALHGGLTHRESGPPRRGYLAVIISTQWNAQRLDDCAGDLRVYANRQVRLQQGASYKFRLDHDGHTLLTGQAVVALD
jgi:predicted hotdog family 3-hydroxylacyl-ACP dehydratase